MSDQDDEQDFVVYGDAEEVAKMPRVTFDVFLTSSCAFANCCAKSQVGKCGNAGDLRTAEERHDSDLCYAA